MAQVIPQDNALDTDDSGPEDDREGVSLGTTEKSGGKKSRGFRSSIHLPSVSGPLHSFALQGSRRNSTNRTERHEGRTESFQAMLTSTGVNLDAIPTSISDAIEEGTWDEFDDANFDPPRLVDLLGLQVLGASVFVLLILCISFPYSDCPMFSNPNKSVLERAWASSCNPLLSFTIYFFSVHFNPALYTRRLAMWFFLRYCVIFMTVQIIAIEVAHRHLQIDRVSTKETVLLVFSPLVGGALIPIVESISLSLHLEHWYNIYAVIKRPKIDKYGRKIENFWWIMFRAIAFLYTFVFMCVGGGCWVVIDHIFLRHEKDFLLQIARPLLLFGVKRAVYLCGNLMYQHSGLLFPHARHYGMCVVFSFCGLLNAIFLGVTVEWSSFAFFLFCSWTTFSTRCWVFSDKGGDIRILQQIREYLDWGRMTPVGRQNIVVLRGWSIFIENFWSGIGYAVALLLYPVAYLLDLNSDWHTTFRHEQTGEILAIKKSIINDAFYSNDNSIYFLLIAWACEFLQDRLFHAYLVRRTGCQFRKHIGRRNFRGQLDFICGGWSQCWVVFVLFVTFKISRYNEIVENASS